MVMNEIRKGKTGKAFKILLMGLMTLAVGGMVFMDVGGFFRGDNLGSNNVAKVGSQTISIAHFDRDLRNVLGRIGMSPQEAYARGYMSQFLTEQIRNSVVEQSAAELGVRVDEARAAETIKDIIQPGLAQGKKPEEVLQQILRNQNMGEAQFVQSIQSQMAIQPFIQALQSGSAVSNSIIGDLVEFQQEVRDVSYIVFRHEDLKNQKTPNDTELMALYEIAKEEFANPETRDYQLLEIVYKAPEGMSEDDILHETYAVSDQVDDLAAGGAKAQDISSQLNLPLTSHTGISLINKDIDEKILQTVFSMQEGEISPVFETSDHKFVTVELTKITPKSYKDFIQVKSDLQKRWMTDQRNMDNKLHVLALMGDINGNKATLASVASAEGKSVQSIKGLSRMDEPKAPFDTQDIPALFRGKVGEAVAIDVDGGYALSVVTNATLPQKEDAELRKQTQAKLLQDMRLENLNMYLEHKRLGMNISVNESLMQQVYGQQSDQPQ